MCGYVHNFIMSKLNDLHGSTLVTMGRAGSNIGLGRIILALLNGILVLILRFPSLKIKYKNPG